MKTSKFTTLLVKASLVACTLFTAACGGGNEPAPAASSASSASSAPAAEKVNYNDALSENIAGVQAFLEEAAGYLANADALMAGEADADVCANAAAEYAKVKEALTAAAKLTQSAMPLMQVGNKLNNAIRVCPAEFDAAADDAVAAFVDKVASFTEKYGAIADALAAAIAKNS